VPLVAPGNANSSIGTLPLDVFLTACARRLIGAW
jgi:hypothetical protein